MRLRCPVKSLPAVLTPAPPLRPRRAGRPPHSTDRAFRYYPLTPEVAVSLPAFRLAYGMQSSLPRGGP